MRLVGIDPGPVESAAVLFNTEKGKVIDALLGTNEEILKRVRLHWLVGEALAIEQVQCYGNVAGKSLFETAYWTGRFCEAFTPARFVRIPRREIKLHLTGAANTKDSHVRQAVIDAVGEPGTKKNPGPTYGLKKDLWQALAVALTCHQKGLIQ